jgi:ATP-dependent DNA ligase
MTVHITQLVGPDGGTVRYAWMGTCSEARGTGHGSNKWYAGLVVERTNGTFDGICAGGAIGSAVKIYPQIQGADSLETARSVVETQVKSKKRQYADDPTYLAGYADQVTLERKEKASADDLPIYWAMLAPSSTPDVLLSSLLGDVADDATEGFVLEEKFNGHRKLVHVVSGGMRFVGRSPGVADPTRPLESNEGLGHLSFQVTGFEGTVLDGELIAEGRLDGHAGVANAKASNPDALAIVLYDLVAFQGRDLTADGQALPYWERRGLLRHVVNEMSKAWRFDGRDADDFPYRIAPMIRQNKRQFHAQVRAMGGEGTMAKNLQGLYHQGEAGRRTKIAMMWKLKHNLYGDSLKKMQEDVVIVGYSAGRGKYSGQIGAVKFGQWVSTKDVERLSLKPQSNNRSLDGYFKNRDRYLVELGQVSGMSDPLRREFTANGDAYIGRVMTISGSWRLPSGAIENPVFEVLRPLGDKVSTECIWEGHP